MADTQKIFDYTSQSYLLVWPANQRPLAEYIIKGVDIAPSTVTTSAEFHLPRQISIEYRAACDSNWFEFTWYGEILSGAGTLVFQTRKPQLKAQGDTRTD